MNIGIYIEMNIVSSLICILLYFQQKKHKVFDFLGSTEFNSLLWTAVTIMAVDIVFWLMIGGLLPSNETAIMAVQSLYYLIQSILPLFFMMYLVDASGQKVKRFWRPLLYIPVLFTAAVLAKNFGSGFAFYVADNSVWRADGYLLVILAPMIYITNSLLLCIFFCVRAHHRDMEQKKIALHMLVCVVISFIGAATCAFVSFVSPWHVFVSALVYLYMQLHSYRESNLDVLAYTDSLTGLKNYAAYSHIMEKMNEKIVENAGSRFAVVVMDVNDLKKVNDSYGHKVGDELLISASRLMCNIFQHSPVCRIGGDEFVAILENSDYENREDLMNRFEECMGMTTFLAGDTQLPVSVAVGFAEYSREKHAEFEDVFQQADTAMYVNKARCKIERK